MKKKRNLIAEAAAAIHTCAAMIELLERSADSENERSVLRSEAQVQRARGRGLEKLVHWPVHSTNGVSEVR